MIATSIREGAPVPIPYREIVLTARIMDAIFDQLSAGRSQRDSGFQVRPLPLNHSSAQRYAGTILTPGS